jgi:hypothetical protein
VASGLLLLAGPIQLLGRVRRAWPVPHRWLGRLYISAVIVVGAGGLAATPPMGVEQLEQVRR